MRKIATTFFVFIVFLPCFSQELWAEVSIDFSAVQSSNTQVFKTLEKDLKNFINTTKWTDKLYDSNERIQCGFFINITERPTNNTFKATLTIQSRRPVYGSTYFTPIFNFQDKNFTFEYTEFEQLIFNDRQFSKKNLTDVLGFYIYFILGLDADTFSNLGGSSYFQTCQKIMQNSENQNYSGWSTFEGQKSRGVMITEMLKSDTQNLREIQYNYHIRGLDQLQNNELYAKNSIYNSLLNLKPYENNLKSIPLDIFLTAKKQEIASIFSGGASSTVNIQQLKELLSTIDPTNQSELWDKMKN